MRSSIPKLSSSLLPPYPKLRKSWCYSFLHPEPLPGFSTAPAEIREMGFGAGMGLPNIKKHSDTMEISSEVGKGTTFIIRLPLKPAPSSA